MPLKFLLSSFYLQFFINMPAFKNFIFLLFIIFSLSGNQASANLGDFETVRQQHPDYTAIAYNWGASHDENLAKCKSDYGNVHNILGLSYNGHCDVGSTWCYQTPGVPQFYNDLCWISMCSKDRTFENGRCEQYNSVVPEESPIPQACVSNPIEVGTGTKLQKESDFVGRGEGRVSFYRMYNNKNIQSELLWHHNYDIKLIVIDATASERIRKKSAPYSSKADACVLGWNNIKSEIDDNWANGAYAVYSGSLCQVKNSNGGTVKNLPIVSTGAIDVSVIPGAVHIRRPNGSTITFQYNGTSNFTVQLGYTAINGDQGTLERVATTDIMWRYTAKNGEIEEYNKSGKLLGITAANGMKQTLSYDSAGLLSNVQDATGNQLLFSYINSKLASVTANNGQVISYTYNTAGLITDVIYPDNTRRIYHYEDSRFPTFLTGITDERGVRYATWAYDAQGRAISSEHAGGVEKTLLAFNADGSTTVTHPLGKQTTYHFDDIAGARRVTQVEGHATGSCLGANQHYTYTPEGWLNSKTDWKGHITTYGYNSKGQEISRTEASGTPQARTTTTEWHPTFQLKARVVEPGQEIIYTYDTEGRLTGTTINAVAAQ